MNWLDFLLLFLFVVYAWAGWRHGFVSNVFSAGGLLAGFLLAIILVPKFIPTGSGDVGPAIFSIAAVFAIAGIGNILGSLIGRKLQLKTGAFRVVDALVGAAFGTVVMMAAAWALGYAVSASTLPYLSAAARDSVVLRQVNSIMPAQAGSTLRAFTDTLTGDVFPQYLDPFETEIIPATDPPSKTVLARPGVQQSYGSVARVVGSSKCGRTVEGSGFVTAPTRVMTNAHVVAGVSKPTVTVGNMTYRAQTVLFNPQLDLAVLKVPGLKADPLPFDTTAVQGDSAVILGFPENGPFQAGAARIRGRIVLRGPDIFGKGRVERDVFSLRGDVRPGNSGGPLISPRGDVVGVIFAASVSDPETGYAVTANEALPVAKAGAKANQPVDTGECS
ncbi:MAG TPA: MarP family serine protease [Aeromicrobium sp.]|nr:MarP family serine protease [Aeromicrobium sp.]